MSRRPLPSASDRLFLTDGGLETMLIFKDGMELPAFASYPLLASETGRARLKRYYETDLRTAERRGRGFLLESPTWRANRDWGAKLGHSPADLVRFNRAAIDLMVELREAHESERLPIVISGNIGPRGDGYRVDARMSAKEAERYHAEQVGTFAGTEADLVSAFTLNYSEEGIGVARAARAAGIPCVISFTVETDGRLPSGEGLGEAIERVDGETGAAPAWFGVNCAHPSHFRQTLAAGGDWVGRIRSVRANASRSSHAELDAATALDDGDPEELAADTAELKRLLPGLAVVGGCCGTDHRHIAAIAAAA